MLQRAQERHGLTLQLGFELEFYLLHKPDKAEPGGSSGRGGVPPPLDGSNYCSASALDAAAPGADGAARPLQCAYAQRQPPARSTRAGGWRVRCAAPHARKGQRCSEP